MNTLKTTLVLSAALFAIGCQSSPFNSFQGANWSQQDIAEQELANLTKNAPKKKSKSEEADDVTASVEEPAAEESADSQIIQASAEFPVDDDVSLSSAATSDIDELLREAQKHESKSNYDLAIQVYNRVLAAHPVNAQAHHRLGVLADLQKNFGKAEQHYQKAMQSNPLDPELLSDVGYSYLLQNRFAESESYLTQATQIQPGHKRATNNLGLLFAKQNKFEQALAMFRQTGSESEAQMKLSQVMQSHGISGAPLMATNGPPVTATNNQAAMANSQQPGNMPNNMNAVVNAVGQTNAASPVGTNPFAQFGNPTNPAAVSNTMATAQNPTGASAQSGAPQTLTPQDFQAMAPIPRQQNAAAVNPQNGQTVSPDSGVVQTPYWNNGAVENPNPNIVQAPLHNSGTANPNPFTALQANTPQQLPANQPQPFVFGSDQNSSASAPAVTNNAVPNNTVTTNTATSPSSSGSNTALPNGARSPFTFGADNGAAANSHGVQQAAQVQPAQVQATQAQIQQYQGPQGQPNGQNGVVLIPTQNDMPMNWPQNQLQNPALNNSATSMNPFASLNGQPVQQPVGTQGANTGANMGQVPANQLNAFANTGGLPAINPQAGNGAGTSPHPQFDAWGNPIPANNIQTAAGFGQNPNITPQNQVFQSNPAQYPGTVNQATGQYYQQSQGMPAAQPVISPGGNNHRNAYGGQSDTVRF